MKTGPFIRPPRVPTRHIDRLCLQTHRLRAIPRLATAAAGDFERLLGALCAAAPALFPDAADAACVLLDDGAGVLRVRAAAGLSAAFWDRAALPVAEAEALAAGGLVLRFARPDHPPPAALDDESLGSGLLCPLRARGDIGGLLLLGARREAAFSDDDALYAEVLATLLGGHLAEIALGRSVMRLQRALWATTRRTSVTDLAPIPAAPEGADEADEVDTLPHFRAARRPPPSKISGSWRP